MSKQGAYWATTGFLLLWGLSYAGLVVFTFGLSTPEDWELLVIEGRITPDYADYISRIPGWVVLVTAIAAVTRLVGAGCLLARSSWARTSYGISLVAVVAIMYRGFFIADVASVIRPSQVLLEIVFLGISVFAVWFSVDQTKSGVLK